MMESMGISHLNLGNYLVALNYEQKQTQLLLNKTKAVVRLYLIEGFDFAQRDIGSFSDPYLKIMCGKKEFNDRENY